MDTVLDITKFGKTVPARRTPSSSSTSSRAAAIRGGTSPSTSVSPSDSSSALRRTLTPSSADSSLTLHSSRHASAEAPTSLRGPDAEKALHEKRLARYAGKDAEKSESSVVGSVDTVIRTPASSSTASGISSHRRDSASSVTTRSKREALSDEEVLMMRRKRIEDVAVRIRQSQEIDLCFLVDCTGSMCSHMEATSKAIINIVDAIHKKNKILKLFVAFVGYRDHCDGPKRIATLDFTSDVRVFTNFVKSQEATGGGDGPEDVFGGLEAALKLSWRHGTKVLFHLGDYPQHGTKYTDLPDDYPGGDPRGLTEEGLLGEIMQRNILYYFGRITDRTDKMIRAFEEGFGHPILSFDLKGSDIKSLVDALTTSCVVAVTESIKASTLVAEGRMGSVHGTKTKSFTIDKDQPDWSKIRTVAGTVSSYRLPKSLEEIKKGPFSNAQLRFSSTTFKISLNPFSKGAEMLAYYGVDTAYDAQVVVLKEFMKIGGNSIERYLEHSETQTVAAYFAQKFTEANEGGKPVKFLKTKVVRVEKTGRNKTTGELMTYPVNYIMEPYFKGAKFKKFNVNSGVVTEFHSTLEAFCHFSFVESGGYLLISDLQGIEFDGKFILTDPAIHCDALRFGDTNLGAHGMMFFFANHECNSTCERLGLKGKPMVL